MVQNEAYWMFRLVFLGTAASIPSAERSLSSILLLCDGIRFLIDCGEGTQRQLLRGNLGFRKLSKVLLTHDHLDHILGLGGLIFTLSQLKSPSTLVIYGGGSSLAKVRSLAQMVRTEGEPSINLHYVEVVPGSIWESENLSIEAFETDHRETPCFGYIFQERTRRRFLGNAADALGIPRGAQRRRLIGGKAITLGNGKEIHPDQVLAPAALSTKVVFLGDTRKTDSLVEASMDADCLIAEATFLSEEAELAERVGHLTGSQAATIAKEARAKCLFLNHISNRYADNPQALLQEARAIFPNTIVPDDLDVFEVRRSGIYKIC